MSSMENTCLLRKHRDNNGRGKGMAAQGQRTSGTLGRFMAKDKQTPARAQ